MYRLVLILLLLLQAGCNSLLLPEDTPYPVDTPISTITLTPGVSLTPSPPGEPTPPGPVTLTVWLPPQFDPASGTPAGDLLEARLHEFGLRRPGVRLEVRIKALEGPGGLLDALAAASAAAPLALPDLVALPRPFMETAALKGLLHPLDGLTEALNDPDWYEYARELARLQESTFGIPIAGDALLLVYRPDILPEPPNTWESTLITEGQLVFPAADPQALTTMTLYQAAGGSFQDEAGRPSLEPALLTQLLNFYQSAETVDLMPFWLTQYETFEQSWSGYHENQAAMAVAWASRYLMEENASSEGMAAAPLPTPTGVPFTLASGWVLSLAGAQSTKQSLTVELAEFLTESSFLAAWTRAAGFLPPRANALSAWPSGPVQSVVGEVALSARLYPPEDITASLAPPLQQVTLQILKQQGDPISLAEAIVDRLRNP